ncbi:MAG: hypothetical protein PHH61_03065 [Candidatus Nanoarchaeia archaeon]|nr:hypothetical protein [Candidatus Nanoarchaeia archaeon]
MGYESDTITRAVLDSNDFVKGIKLNIRNKLNPVNIDVVWLSLRQAKDLKMIPSPNVTNAWLHQNVAGHTLKMVYF